ncbi:hypothetical protein M427DRAFT_396988 [Gonapodya prolifera JEL478]|uniref:Uncharacterized protein n=1 Tax=Gonapodya prolifera (strain JEL478) TaxID=1344416 RepID=A0A139A7R7_GONPJ|nr:hypothetical protein M427DRAFT_396988 [Gonapodya prolifera JEL478]|eukprot:KXS12413.1 hypothetical protein M427DRAFT_396988 [Gonapodya prolifera JEL478]
MPDHGRSPVLGGTSHPTLDDGGDSPSTTASTGPTGPTATGTTVDAKADSDADADSIPTLLAQLAHIVAEVDGMEMRARCGSGFSRSGSGSGVVGGMGVVEAVEVQETMRGGEKAGRKGERMGGRMGRIGSRTRPHDGATPAPALGHNTTTTSRRGHGTGTTKTPPHRPRADTALRSSRATTAAACSAAGSGSLLAAGAGAPAVVQPHPPPTPPHHHIPCPPSLPPPPPPVLNSTPRHTPTPPLSLPPVRNTHTGSRAGARTGPQSPRRRAAGIVRVPASGRGAEGLRSQPQPQPQPPPGGADVGMTSCHDGAGCRDQEDESHHVQVHAGGSAGPGERGALKGRAWMDGGSVGKGRDSAVSLGAGCE